MTFKRLVRISALVIILLSGLLISCGPSAEEQAETAIVLTASAVTPTPIPYDLTVLVVGEEDAPIVGATIVLEETGEEIGTQITDHVGQTIWYDLPGETVNLSISSEGYYPLDVSSSIDRGKSRMTISLEPDPYDVILRLNWDGERCSYEGPTLLKPGPVRLLFFNQTEGLAATNYLRLTGDKTIQDALDFMGEDPSYLHHPVWTDEVVGVYGGTYAGETRIWEGELEPGIHFMICQRFSDGGIFFGADFTVEE